MSCYNFLLKQIIPGRTIYIYPLAKSVVALLSNPQPELFQKLVDENFLCQEFEERTIPQAHIL